MNQTDRTLVELTAEIAASYVANNRVNPDELPELIRSVHSAMKTAETGAIIEQPEERPAPAVPIKKSVTADHIISLFDGRRFKSMKRYLAKQHNMTPADYRAYWGLPQDYPMVAPNYASLRSSLAREAGLGQGGRKPAMQAAPAPARVPEAAPAPARRGRKPKAIAAE